MERFVIVKHGFEDRGNLIPKQLLKAWGNQKSNAEKIERVLVRFSSTCFTLSIEALMDNVKPVEMEKNEIENRLKAVFQQILSLFKF